MSFFILFILFYSVYFFFFFFSSRRRHTRSYGDWSSDVCSSDLRRSNQRSRRGGCNRGAPAYGAEYPQERIFEDRKSTRLNSSHRTISYAVFCLKKKKTISSTLEKTLKPNHSVPLH